MKKINNKGFTFIELLVYMGILSVFMLAVITLISSTVSSNQKMNARKRLQTQATETYDLLSDMMMGANSVKIAGDAYIQTAGGSSYTQVSGTFVTEPYDAANPDKYTKKADGSIVLTSNGLSDSSLAYFLDASGFPTSAPKAEYSTYYDIADIKAFTEASTGKPSDDPETIIDIDYLQIKYASNLATTPTGEVVTVNSGCTLHFDEANHQILIHRYSETSSPQAWAENFMIADSTADVFCKNVEEFQLQVNAETGSFAIILKLKDARTTATYDMEGIVSLRNSFVLKRHAW